MSTPTEITERDPGMPEILDFVSGVEAGKDNNEIAASNYIRKSVVAAAIDAANFARLFFGLNAQQTADAARRALATATKLAVTE